MEDIPALFVGSGQDGAQRGKSLGAGLGAEGARDFLLALHHAQILLGLIIRKRHVGMSEEAQDSVLAGEEAPDQGMPDAAVRAATAVGPLEGRRRPERRGDCDGGSRSYRHQQAYKLRQDAALARSGFRVTRFDGTNAVI